jgi:hypothetical protein
MVYIQGTLLAIYTVNSSNFANYWTGCSIGGFNGVAANTFQGLINGFKLSNTQVYTSNFNISTVENTTPGTYTKAMNFYTVPATTLVLEDKTLSKVTASVTDVSGSGNTDGAITLTSSGGDTLSYLWNDGVTTQNRSNIGSGTYYVTITGTRQSNVRVFQLGGPVTVSGAVTNVSVYGEAGGAIVLTLTPSNGTCTFAWSDGAKTKDRSGLAAGTYTVTITSGTYTQDQTFTVYQPLRVTYTQTNIDTYGQSTGAIDLTVLGATGTYTYLWNDSVTTQDRTGLPAGTYSVTITSGSYSVTQTVSLLQPIGISYSKTDVVTFGQSTGAVDLSVVGGNGTYTYLWTDGVTTPNRSNLPAGAYSVTVTSGSYSSTQSISITQQINIAYTKTDISVYATSTGAINITVTGGDGTFTYLWNDGVTTEDRSNLPAGTYSVTVTSGGSTFTQSFTITQPAPPVPDDLIADIPPNKTLEEFTTIVQSVFATYNYSTPRAATYHALFAESKTGTSLNIISYVSSSHKTDIKEAIINICDDKDTIDTASIQALTTTTSSSTITTDTTYVIKSENSVVAFDNTEIEQPIYIYFVSDAINNEITYGDKLSFTITGTQVTYNGVTYNISSEAQYLVTDAKEAYKVEYVASGSSVINIQYANSVTLNLNFDFMETIHNGHVGIGTQYPATSLDLYGNLKFTGSLYKNNTKTLLWYNQGNYVTADTTNTSNIGIGTTTPQYSLDISGTTGARATSYANFSDRRLKTEITDETVGLDYINTLEPKQFYFTNNSNNLVHGFIAQDFQSNNELTDSILFTDADESSLSLSYFDLIAPIVRSLQELNEQYNQLKLEYDALIASQK